MREHAQFNIYYITLYIGCIGLVMCLFINKLEAYSSKCNKIVCT